MAGHSTRRGESAPNRWARNAINRYSTFSYERPMSGVLFCTSDCKTSPVGVQNDTPATAHA
jgi:hypothetical protein